WTRSSEPTPPPSPASTGRSTRSRRALTRSAKSAGTTSSAARAPSPPSAGSSGRWACSAPSSSSAAASACGASTASGRPCSSSCSAFPACPSERLTRLAAPHLGGQVVLLHELVRALFRDAPQDRQLLHGPALSLAPHALDVTAWLRPRLGFGFAPLYRQAVAPDAAPRGAARDAPHARELGDRAALRLPPPPFDDTLGRATLAGADGEPVPPGAGVDGLLRDAPQLGELVGRVQRRLAPPPLDRLAGHSGPAAPLTA